MSEQTQKQEKTKIKQLPCGGYAIIGVDGKSKAETQIGYIGQNLPLEGYFPGGYIISK
jgi:hypothetical protein